MSPETLWSSPALIARTFDPNFDPGTVEINNLLARRRQTSRALKLPPEVLKEIISYFKEIPLPLKDGPFFMTYGRHERVPTLFLERNDALRNLSQTCRSWRSYFFPLLWAHFQVCASHIEKPSRRINRIFSDALLRKCSGVLQNPEILLHVKAVSVVLDRYAEGKVLAAFVKALKAMPNLSILQIVGSHWEQLTNKLRAGFEGHSFPQVETVILPVHAHDVLRCCSGAKRVICLTDKDPLRLINAISEGCKEVEEIGYIDLQYGWQCKLLLDAVPNLRSLRVKDDVETENLEPIAKWSKNHITDITIQTDEQHPHFAFKWAASHLHEALKILRRSKSNRPKSLLLEYNANTEEFDAAESWIMRINLQHAQIYIDRYRNVADSADADVIDLTADEIIDLTTEGEVIDLTTIDDGEVIDLTSDVDEE